MKAKVLGMITVAVAVFLCGQFEALAQDDRKEVVIGERIDIRSDILNEDRAILVGLPDDYDESMQSYPVLIVLDGDSHFQTTTALTKFLASNEFSPGILVVGIENTIRIRDLTPPAQDPRMAELEPEHGGSVNFRSFIANELLPWLDENYRTHSYRILVGHSLGGLFAIDSLLSDPELFDAYIAISPSLHWDEQRIVERAEALFEGARSMNVSLYMTAGNEGGPLLAAARSLSAVLDVNAPEGLAWTFEHMPLETHGSVPMRSTYQGLEFIFSDWSIRDPLQMYADYGIGAIEHFYETSNEVYGFDRSVPEFTMVSIARELLDSGEIDELALLRRRYPDVIVPPPGFLEGRAALYRDNGQNDEAIALYRMVLEIDPGSEIARQALTELGNDFSDVLP